MNDVRIYAVRFTSKKKIYTIYVRASSEQGAIKTAKANDYQKRPRDTRITCYIPDPQDFCYKGGSGFSC